MVYIACDHGGTQLKSAIIDKLKAMGETVTDLGTHSTASVDYPDYGLAAAKRVAAEPGSKGIVICKTGVGMSITANKVKGIRCALCTSPDMGRLCREHNDANMLALGAGNTDIQTALTIVQMFMTSKFEGGRHATRVNKMMAIEE